MSDFLHIRWANTHNLQNIDVSIPKNKLVVVTGVSGSGKSSLVFNTLYAEWQRRYLESLSTYARMFIQGTNEDVQVDEILGLTPMISIDQKTTSHNPRSTVGTITEIYDFLRVLFLHLGVPHCPEHSKPLIASTPSDVEDEIKKLPNNTKFYICAPVEEFFESEEEMKGFLVRMGYVRYMIKGKIYSLSDTSPKKFPIQIFIVVDRLIKNTEETDTGKKRLRDSLRTAFSVGGGRLSLFLVETKKQQDFCSKPQCPHCLYTVEDYTLSHFSFNSHHGACRQCHGLGYVTSFLEKDIINENLSIGEWAILPWGQSVYYKKILESIMQYLGVSIHTPYILLDKKIQDILLFWMEKSFHITHTFENGDIKTFQTQYEGIVPYLKRKLHETEDIVSGWKQKQRIAQYSTKICCPECWWNRLKKEILFVLFSGKNIWDITHMSVGEAKDFFTAITLTKTQKKIAKNILKNIRERLEFLEGVGLEYISLSRSANTLSGGESQRIRLATQIGTRLEGITYALDEPSIGLHPRDNNLLIENLKKLVQIGNSLIVVEHDEEIMRQSDYIIDIGPGAGVHGGKVMFSGTFDEIKKSDTDTAKYISGKKHIEVPENSRKISGFITVSGARENNLKNITVQFPLGVFTVVTGVSGSGKSSLVNKTLAPFLQNTLNHSKRTIGTYDAIEGYEDLDKVIIVDQSPIGKTPRSNPATYTGVFSYIREVFAMTPDAKKRGFGPGHFSFNTKQGRCPVCEWDGVKKIQMHFLPDVHVRCEVCEGSRYNEEVRMHQYKGKSIADVLDMTVEDARIFFSAHPRISHVLQTLENVGLGYITLGQSSTTLSGGESQRVKLATELAKRSTSKTMYILDEPTTGLHFSDIQKLLLILDSLVNKWNSVLVIEHNLDFIVNADYIIDIGPEGGMKGGDLVFSGKKEDLISCKKSHTGIELKKYLDHKKKLWTLKRK